MERLSYQISINAPKAKVWDVMLDPITYRRWVKAFSPDSQYEGEWTEGSHITFFDPNMGGTEAILETVTPGKRIFARHVATVGPDGSDQSQSDAAQKWIGSTEEYVFTEEAGVTELSIEIETHADFAQMFADSWPEALRLLKGLCET